MYFFLYFFQFFSILSAMLAIFSKNTVHSILYLILVFFNVSGLLFLINIDYIAMVYIVVYVGAIAILFLFVIMMLNIKLQELSLENNFFFRNRKVLVTFIINIAFWIVYICFFKQTTSYPNKIFSNTLMLNNNFVDSSVTQTSYIDWFDSLLNVENIHSIGFIMYSFYFFSFIMSSFLLLIAMIGSIILTIKNDQETKRQFFYKQISRGYRNSIKLQ